MKAPASYADVIHRLSSDLVEKQDEIRFHQQGEKLIIAAVYGIDKECNFDEIVAEIVRMKEEIVSLKCQLPSNQAITE